MISVLMDQTGDVTTELQSLLLFDRQEKKKTNTSLPACASRCSARMTFRSTEKGKIKDQSEVKKLLCRASRFTQ